jgi:hypothetical protein
MAFLLALAGPIGAATAGAAGAAAVTAAATFSLSTLFTGASLAWSIGSTLFSAFQGANQSVTGPRLKDLHVQSAAFGTPIKRFWGVDRMAGELIWIGSDGKGGRGIRETAHTETVGGKGKGGGTTRTYTYDADFAISINGASNCRGVIRIWAGPKLIYDNSKSATLESIIGTGLQLNSGGGEVTFYDGNEDQEPPAIIEALSGVGNTSAYRNQFLAVFSNFDVTDYGGVIPHFSFECFTEGDEAWTMKEIYAVNDYLPPGAAKQASWSFVDPNGEIVLVGGLQGINYTTVTPDGEPGIRSLRLLANGDIIPEERPPSGTVSPSFLGGGFSSGIADEHCSVLGTAGVKWLLRPGKAITEFILPSGYSYAGGVPGSFFAKKGEFIYFLGEGAWYGDMGLFKYNADTGAFLAAADIAELYSFGFTQQCCIGDDYLWVFHKGHGDSERLLKFDLDTLELIGDIDLGINNSIITGQGELEALFVTNDNSIQFIGHGGAGAIFHEYKDGELTLLGDALAPQGIGAGALYVRGGAWYAGSFGSWGAYDANIRVWTEGNEGFCCPLWKIVRDICLACGLEERDIDVTELTDCVRGYTLDQQMTGRDAILPLQRYGFFDGRESDLVLEFPKRGHDAVMTIPEADMAARPSLDVELPDLIAETRGEETEIPVRVHCRFKDQDATYQTGHAYAARLTSESKQTVTADVPIVMTASKAKQICDVLMANYHMERSPKEILVSRRYLPLDAADPVNLEVVA